MVINQIPNFRIIVLLLAVWPAGSTCGQDSPQPAQNAPSEVDFGRDILPIFRAHCFSCHGPETQESNYRLDVKSVALGIADFGDPPVIPGNSEGSPLIQFASGEGDILMPPPEAGERLNDLQIQLLRRWIDAGADWPDGLAGQADSTITTGHWSFQAVAEPPVPQVDPVAHFPLRNAIDHFVLHKMQQQRLEPSPAADRVTLIRRLYLGMHGLHPSLEQAQAFVMDSSPDAWQTTIESVLASHHYGERWARHWLDVVRFGESTGYEVNRDRANAWYYRDYVIDALNNDKSYRDFVIEQLAGDATGADEATGFLVGGPYDTVKSPDVNLTLMQRQDELADYVNTTSTAFLGLTVGCARCHNHKFDPILQRDYYAIQAVFAGVQHGERKLPHRADAETLQKLDAARNELLTSEMQFNEMRNAAPPPDANPADALDMVNATMNIDSFEPVQARFLRFNIQATNSLEPCLDELEVYSVAGNNIALASTGSTLSSSGDYVGNPKHKLDHVNDGQYGNDFSWISSTPGSGRVQIEFPHAVNIDRVVWGRDRQETYSDRLAIHYSIDVSEDGETWQEVSGSNRRIPFLVNGTEPESAFIHRLNGQDFSNARELLERITTLRQQVKQLDQAIPAGYVGQFREPDRIHRLHRGDPQSPREAVGPDTLRIMGSLGLDEDSVEQQRRLEFARWIVSADNPLTARVIVNRVWHFHFGRGLVETPSDFGLNGARPSHPELLDWLACRFMKNGWSLKWLHRQILESSTWQQSSQPCAEALATDANCKWLWRFPPRRLEAEAIRDCTLQLSGKLNLQAGGPGFLLFEIDRENVHHYSPLENFNEEHFRRMVYMTKIRQEQDAVFGVFDCPDGGQTIPRRTRSTTALQAANLLNSKFMLEQSGYLAARLKTTAGDDPRQQIRMAFRLAYSRQPSDEELEEIAEFIRQHGLESFCRVLLNTNEFLFLS